MEGRLHIHLKMGQCVCVCVYIHTSLGLPVVKNPPVNAGDVRDMGSIRGSGRPLGGWHGNPLQYPCLENPMCRGD